MTFTPLACGEAVIPAGNISYGFVQYEYLPRNSCNITSADAVRAAAAE
ncbi:MAG TPA: hypothetical protein IAB66_10050 [Candidatus Caccousia avistercoris]|nr:hypothetical protein [Candidatus Caccousia avistercoris]